MARDIDRQVAEFQARTAVLNGFTALGTPIAEVAGRSVRGKERSADHPICAIGPGQTHTSESGNCSIADRVDFSKRRASTAHLAKLYRYDRCAHTFVSAIVIAAVVIFWIS